MLERSYGNRQSKRELVQQCIIHRVPTSGKVLKIAVQENFYHMYIVERGHMKKGSIKGFLKMFSCLA